MSRDALDVLLVLRSSRQKAYIKHIQETWRVLHFLSHKIANASIVTRSVRLDVGGKKRYLSPVGADCSVSSLL